MVTVTSARYTVMLQEFLARELHCRGIYLNTVWFQQDSTTAYTARAFMAVVREMLQVHMISREGDVACLSLIHI